MTKKLKQELTADQRLLIAIEEERQAKALENYLRTGHGTPKTRREFLASGLIGVSGFIAAPSIYELVTREAQALAQQAGCDTGAAPGASGMMAYVNVNLSGGAALMANYVPHNSAGAPLQSYSNIGLGSPANFQIVREFGNVPFPSVNNVLVGKFLEGIRAGAVNAGQNNAPTSLAQTAFVAVCIRSQDDTGGNPMNISGLVQAAGLKGSELPNMGTRNSATGVGQNAALVRPPAPLRVQNFTDVQGALAASGILAQQLNAAQRTSLLELLKNLSSSQKERLIASSSGQTLGKLVSCATDKNLQLAASGGAGIDPRADANIATAWGIAANTATNNAQVIQASLVFNALNGKAGAVGIDLGGYDYHGSGRAQTDAADRAAGVVVGRILRSAEIMQKPVFIHITSDGAVNSQTSDQPTSNFTGDSGSRGVQFIIVYNPAGRPATNGFQMGSFTDAQAADDQFLTAWTPERASAAVFANYLKLTDKMSLLNTIMPNQFSVDEQTRIIKFG